MKLVDTTCPHCGSAIKVDAGNKNAVCEFCGTTFLIDDEVQHIQYDNAEEAGYKFEKGRQRAQAEAFRQAAPQYRSASRPVQRKRRTWLWVVGWILVFPLPLTILLLRNQRMSKGYKIGIIAVAWIVYLAIALGASGNKKDTANNTDSTGSGTTEIGQATSQIETEQPNSTTVETEPQSLQKGATIDAFVDAYNAAGATELAFLEDFIPSDKSGKHYRVEFRLSAYSDAVGKSYSFGEQTVDIIERSNIFDKNHGILRIYADGLTLDAASELVRIASPILDSEISKEELSNVIDLMKEGNSINGHYFSNLCLLMLGSEKSGYDIMIKLGND